MGTEQYRLKVVVFGLVDQLLIRCVNYVTRTLHFHLNGINMAITVCPLRRRRFTTVEEAQRSANGLDKQILLKCIQTQVRSGILI